MIGLAQRHAPGFGGFIGVARADDIEVGNGAQRRQLFDRLVRRAVLADPDRVVRKDENNRQFHDRGQPDRRPHIVAEYQEGGGERAQVTERHAVGDGAHGVFADAEMHVAAAGRRRFQVLVALAGQLGLGRGRKVGGAADQGRGFGGDGVQHLAAGVA